MGLIVNPISVRLGYSVPGADRMSVNFAVYPEVLHNVLVIRNVLVQYSGKRGLTARGLSGSHVNIYLLNGTYDIHVFFYDSYLEYLVRRFVYLFVCLVRFLYTYERNLVIRRTRATQLLGFSDSYKNFIFNKEEFSFSLRIFAFYLMMVRGGTTNKRCTAKKRKKQLFNSFTKIKPYLDVSLSPGINSGTYHGYLAWWFNNRGFGPGKNRRMRSQNNVLVDVRGADYFGRRAEIVPLLFNFMLASGNEEFFSKLSLGSNRDKSSFLEQRVPNRAAYFDIMLKYVLARVKLKYQYSIQKGYFRLFQKNRLLDRIFFCLSGSIYDQGLFSRGCLSFSSGLHIFWHTNLKKSYHFRSSLGLDLVSGLKDVDGSQISDKLLRQLVRYGRLGSILYLCIAFNLFSKVLTLVDNGLKVNPFVQNINKVKNRNNLLRYPRHTSLKRWYIRMFKRLRRNLFRRSFVRKYWKKNQFNFGNRIKGRDAKFVSGGGQRRHFCVSSIGLDLNSQRRYGTSSKVIVPYRRTFFYLVRELKTKFMVQNRRKLNKHFKRFLTGAKRRYLARSHKTKRAIGNYFVEEYLPRSNIPRCGVFNMDALNVRTLRGRFALLVLFRMMRHYFIEFRKSFTLGIRRMVRMGRIPVFRLFRGFLFSLGGRLSSHRDYLSQWRLYDGNYTGIGIYTLFFESLKGFLLLGFRLRGTFDIARIVRTANYTSYLGLFVNYESLVGSAVFPFRLYYSMYRKRLNLTSDELYLDLSYLQELDSYFVKFVEYFARAYVWFSYGRLCYFYLKILMLRLARSFSLFPVNIRIFTIGNDTITASFFMRFLIFKLERRYTFMDVLRPIITELRRVMVRTVFLKGYKIQFLGRMGRRERSRRIIASAGMLPLSTRMGFIEYSAGDLILKNGACSVKVGFYRPHAFWFDIFSFKCV